MQRKYDLHHQHQSELLIQGIMDLWFHVVYDKFQPNHPNVSAEIKAHQSSQFLSSLMFSSFYEPVQIFGFWFLADMSSTQCDLLLLCPLCFKSRCVVYSEMVFYNSNKWPFELMLSSYQPKRIWSFSSDMNWDGYTSGGRAGNRLIRRFVDHLLAA